VAVAATFAKPGLPSLLNKFNPGAGSFFTTFFAFTFPFEFEIVLGINSCLGFTGSGGAAAGTTTGMMEAVGGDWVGASRC